MGNDERVKKEVWQRQAAALACDQYRVTLMRDAVGRNYSNSGTPDGQLECFYSVADVAAAIERLRAENARGWNVFITPIDPSFHYFVVDDVPDESAVARLKAEGYTPCLVLRSSSNSIQCILRTPKLPGRAEQSCANRVVVDINQRHGDKRFVGVIHPFRLAGFSNKKPNRSNEFTRIVETNPSAICLKATAALAVVRQAADVKPGNPTASPVPCERLKSISTAATSPANVEYDRLRAGYEHACSIGKFRRDESLIDFKCAKEMARQGYSEGEIAAAIVAGSPNIEGRHPQFEKWATGVARNGRKY